jgi:hypothetical protein
VFVYFSITLHRNVLRAACLANLGKQDTDDLNELRKQNLNFVMKCKTN